MSVYINNDEDIAKMRASGTLAAELLDYIGDFVKPGVTTNELNQLCHDYQLNVQGTIPAPLGYGEPPFPKSICTSVNHVICHGIPDDKALKKGDMLNIDVTIIKDGYHGDSSRMFMVGEVSPHAQRLSKVTHECMMLGIEQVKPGATLGDVAMRFKFMPRTMAIPSCKNSVGMVWARNSTANHRFCTMANVGQA